MNGVLRKKQHLMFALLLGISALMAILSYHELHKDMILFRKGEQLLDKHDFQSAIPLFIDSFRRGNASPQLLKSLENACRGAGKEAEAIDAYRSFLTRFPADRTVRISLARSLARGGRYNEAVIEYRKFLGEKP